MTRGLVAIALLGLALAGLAAGLPSPDLHDFRSIMASGAAAQRGLDPYGTYPLSARVELLGLDKRNPNLNPPISVLVFEALTPRGTNPHDPRPTQAMFEMLRRCWAAYAACLGLILWLLHGRYPHAGLLRLLWVLALAGLWDTLMLGVPYLPMALAVVGAWVLLESDRPVAAGLVAGCVVAVKLHLLAWPVALLLAGHRRFAAAALGAAAAVSLVPLARYGPQIYGQWIAVVGALDAERVGFCTNASLPGLGARFGLGAVGTVAAAVALLGLALWAMLRRPGARRVSEVALVASHVASPVAWVHYVLFLLPVYFTRRRWHPLVTASAVLWLVPVFWNIRWMDGEPWQQWTGGSVYTWALLLLLAGTGLSGDSTPQAPPATCA